MRRKILKGCLYTAATLLVLTLVAVAFLFYQGHRTPDGRPDYVAMGSSYAAGAGLGPLQAGSPLLCARSVAGYPRQLARRLTLSTVDMSCGGAVTAHLLSGGQYFQGPQMRVIDARTRLVTITIGGNDVGLVGDLSMLALRKQDSFSGWLARTLSHDPNTSRERGFARLHDQLVTLIGQVRARAPQATIVVATYPAILPPRGTCPALQLTSAEVDAMRPVEDALAATTSAAAAQGGAILVDMHALGAAHHACSATPWTHGWAALLDAPFHPTLAGARATADAIVTAVRGTAVAPAIRQE